jgi:PST family polysaccharide transporter
VSFLQVFKEAGLPTATIQREKITEAEVSNLFWINVGLSSIVAGLMAGMSPLIARFFREPELVSISIVLSAAFLMDGMTAQHLALLNRQMRFGIISLIETMSTGAGLAIGVVMAFSGWNYWSVVVGMLSTALSRLLAIWLASGWRPRAPSRGTGVRPLVSFGVDLTLVGLIYSLSRGFDGILIGRFLGADALGLYSRATALLTRPIERLVSPIYVVTVPVLSRLQQEPARYRRAFLFVFEGLVIFGCFFTGLFLPLAAPVVVVVLGDKWSAAAPIFAALTVAALHLPLGAATSWLYTSQGRGRELLLVAVIGSAITIGCIIAGLQAGPSGVAAAYSLSGILGALPVTFWVGGRSGPVSTRDLWRSYLVHWPVLATVLAATILTSFELGVGVSPEWRLVVCIAAGTLAGAATLSTYPPSRHVARRLWESWRSRALQEIPAAGLGT